MSCLPAAFEQRERALLGPRFEALFAAPGPAPARGLTVNTLRCTPGQVARDAGLPLEPSPFCARAFRLTDPDLRPGRHPWHHAGAFYVQEPSAAAPAALLGVRPGMRVADLCAAPGGKSSQLAAALAGQGLLLSNEYDPARAEILRQNLERMGVTNAVITNEDTARLAAALPGLFDCVLVDAPCSGEGMFRKEAAAVAQYEPALVEHCAALGASILDNAAALVAPGGWLMLSTCTFAPAEDEGQAAAFLARHPEFAQCDLSGCGFGRPGEANRAPGAPPNFDAARCRRIWPADGGEGHFVAKFQRVAHAKCFPNQNPQGEPAPGHVCLVVMGQDFASEGTRYALCQELYSYLAPRADCNLVASGRLRAYMLSDEGREITLYRLFEGDVCLLSAACALSGLQLEVTVEAERDTEFFVIPADVYRRAMAESAPLANFTNALMAARFSGPKHGMPAASSASTMPRQSGSSGVTTA